MEKPTLDQLRIERKPEKESSGFFRKLLILLAVLLAAVAFAYFFWLRPDASVEVRTMVARTLGGSSGSTVLNASGYVTARRQATVSSKFTGKVTEVLIEEGMRVETGQVLARLDDSNIQASFRLAEAQLTSSRRSLKETEALLREARLNFERTTRLVDRQLASEAELDRSRALEGSLSAQFERKQADVEVASRQVDIYRQQIEDTIIRAPFAGVVVAKNAQPGEMISPISAGGGFTRTGIGTIVDMKSLEIEIDVNEAYINRVTAGQKVVATLDAYPDWKIPCHVIAIIPTADRQRATVEVRVGFDELDPRVLPDMGVKVAFQESGGEQPDEQGVWVPAQAVRVIEGRNYVFVISGSQAERRAIASSGPQDGGVRVTGGLSAGERIVVESKGDLAEGDTVREMEP